MLNALKNYYQKNRNEIMEVLTALSYSVSPRNTYCLYHAEG